MCKRSPLLPLISAAVLAGGVLLLSCARKEEKVPIPKKTVRLYTSVPVKMVESIKLRFEEENPAIQLEVFRAGTRKIVKRILEEAEAGSVNADVIWLADFCAAEELKARGLLQKYVSAEAAGIIPIFIDKEGYYTGSRLLSMVVAYNKTFVRERPKSYLDLLDPKWKGKAGIVDPEVSGSAFFTVGTLLQSPEFGWRYYSRLYQNQCVVVHNNPILTEKIAGGELHLGITIDFTVRKLLQESPTLPLGYAFPRDGIVAVASPVAISRDCREIEASRTFVDWVLSANGQGFMSRELGITPVREDVDVPEGMIPLRELRIIPSNTGKIFRDREDAKRVFANIFSGQPVETIRTETPATVRNRTSAGNPARPPSWP